MYDGFSLSGCAGCPKKISVPARASFTSQDFEAASTNLPAKNGAITRNIIPLIGAVILFMALFGNKKSKKRK